MKESVDPYDALASIFLPGGGSEDPDAWTEDRVIAEAEAEAEAVSPDGAAAGTRAGTVGATGCRDESTPDRAGDATDAAQAADLVMRPYRKSVV